MVVNEDCWLFKSDFIAEDEMKETNNNKKRKKEDILCLYKKKLDRFYFSHARCENGSHRKTNRSKVNN
jgi:hypothetical protein